ncbi:MAG: C39 family peptidase [Anaerolineaceae bacterium]|nr:C39 family peptidase [Anaerolineaceae bacterium]
MNQKNRIGIIVVAVVIFGLLFSFLIPGIRERILWRVDRLWIKVLYAINPPEEDIFIPNQEAAEFTTPEGGVASLPTPTALFGNLTATVSENQSDTVEATPQATSIPDSYYASGFKYVDQHGAWNYCAPANLAMALTFWGWEGDRLDVGHSVKPNDNDMNVMPYELESYVNNETPYQAIARVGGDIDLLKQLVAADFPVVVEKGTVIRETSTGQDTWMGHYSYVTGYDDATQMFMTQDSFYTPDYEVPYSLLEDEWQGFNYVFLVVYPPEKSAQLMTILGELENEARSYQIALENASSEVYSKNGIQTFFAWYNRGSSLSRLQDYGGAAEAFDKAFQTLAAMPEGEAPKKVMRIVWYETTPYFAYYYTGRYNDVINLATQVMDMATNVPYLEESFYWRALARFAVGQDEEAAKDLCTSLEYHPGFAPSEAAMNSFGVYTCP